MIRNFLARFRRKPPQFRARPTDDWHPGDLGECIHSGPWTCIYTGMRIDGPRVGDLILVTGVSWRSGLHVIQIHGSGSCWWDAAPFRKITPEKIEAADRHFIGVLKSLRKVDA